MTAPAGDDRRDEPVPAQERALLRQHLVRHRIAGEVDTSREHNLANYRRLASRDPKYLFGLTPAGRWHLGDVLALMARRCGVSPDPAFRAGVDTIDPDLTLARLDDFSARLRLAVSRRERVLVATGHPTGILVIHLEIVRALSVAGCRLLTPPAPSVRYVGGVAILTNGPDLQHTHSPEPMRAVLGALAEVGEPPPDLVVADHGWAGAAGAAGIDTIAFADSNDPALFVGEAEGKILVTVPLDDNVSPALYAPLTSYLLHTADLRHERRTDPPLPHWYHTPLG